MGSVLVGCCDTAYTQGEDVLFNCPNPLALNAARTDLADTHYFHERKQSLASVKTPVFLQLTVLHSAQLEPGLQMKITPQGLEGSQRGDGLTFFGSRRRLNGEVVNDVVLPNEDTSRGRHFLIYFNTDLESYWLRDLAKGAGVFVKLVEPVPVKENMLVRLGNSYVIVNAEGTRLELKVFNDECSGNTL